MRIALSRPELEQSWQAELGLAESEWLAARTWPNPVLRAERERPGDHALAATETTVTLAQEFDFSGRRGLQRRAGALGVQAARANVTLARRELRAEVLRRYFAAVAAEVRAQFHARRAQDLAELARIAAQRREAGDLSGFESRRMMQTAALARAQAAEATAQGQAARERLAGLVGERARDGALRLFAPLPPDAVPSLPALLEAISHAPRLAALAAEREAALAAARAAARLPLPVTLGLGQKRIESAAGDDDALVLEASVPLPLFDRNQAARARARAAAARAESRYQLALNDEQAHLRALWAEAARLTEAARRLNAAHFAETDELARIARASFAAGELDLTGLLDAYESALAAREQALDLQHRARVALVELELFTSGDLP